MVRRPFGVGVGQRSVWVLAGSALAALINPHPASAQFAGPFCGGSVTENCIISLTVGGAPPTSNITATLTANPVSGVYTIAVMNTNNADPFELSSAANGLTTASVVSVTFKMSNAATDPRAAVSTGLISSWSVNTAPSPNEITLTATPRASSWARATPSPGVEDEPPGGCTPGFCENTADVDYQALLLAALDPMPPPAGASAELVNFANKFNTGFTSTNAQYFSPIPTYTSSTAAISFFVGAPHFKSGGSVVNTGFVRMFIPEGVITDPTLWNVTGGSAALAANNSLTTVTVGGSSADFAIEALSAGGVALGALVKVGETTPFSYSVPEVVIKPAATAPFTDDPLVAGTSVVRVVHITELRTRIDAIRAARGLAAYSWTDPTLSAGSTTIRAVHLTDLRTALDQAYAAAGRSPPSYTDATLTGVAIKVVHIAELRAAVLGIE